MTPSSSLRFLKVPKWLKWMGKRGESFGGATNDFCGAEVVEIWMGKKGSL